MELIVLPSLLMLAGTLVPYLVGRYVESAWWGLLLLSVLPIAISIFGIVAYLTESKSTEDDPATRYLVLPVGAGILMLMGLLGWAIGRRWRKSGT